MTYWKAGDIESVKIRSAKDETCLVVTYYDHREGDLEETQPLRCTTFLVASNAETARRLASLLNSKRTLPEDRFDPAILTGEKSSEQKHLRTYLPQLCRAVKVISDAPTDGADIQIESLQLLSFIEAWIKPRMPAGSSYNDTVVEAIRTIAEAAIAHVADKE